MCPLFLKTKTLMKLEIRCFRSSWSPREKDLCENETKIEKSVRKSEMRDGKRERRRQRDPDDII